MKTLFFDMDGVLVDFQSGIDQLPEETYEHYRERLDEVPGIFHLMKPIEGSQQAVESLSFYYDCFILTTSPWNNPTAASDKVNWVKRYFPITFHKKVIITHRKDLIKGDYLIDDRTANGAGEFEGEHIHFGTGKFITWPQVIDHLMNAKSASVPMETLSPDKEMEGFYNVMLDFEENNEDYARLMTHHMNGEPAYQEVIDFLDIAKPEWRKYKELGISAPELILEVMEMWEDEYEDISFNDWIKEVYEDVASLYDQYACHNRSQLDDIFRKQFEEQYGSYDPISFASKSEYDRQLEQVKKNFMEDEYWPF